MILTTTTGACIGPIGTDDQAHLRHRRRRLLARQGPHRLQPRNLLTARGLRVVMQKLDPYLNVDPGTMNPFQHGEVFVTEDGAETDLDIGHYERFLDRDLTGTPTSRPARSTPTVIAKERRGNTSATRSRSSRTSPTRSRPGSGRWPRRTRRPRPDVVITEVGGTVGDIESLPFLEAIRQVRHDIGRDNCFYLHVSLVPYLAPSRRVEDQADPALRRRAAQHRYPAGRDRLPLRPGDPREAQAQAVAVLRRRPRGRVSPRRTRRASTTSPRCCTARAGRVRGAPARPVVPRRRLDPLGRPARPGPPPQARPSPSPWSASTSTCPTPTCRSVRPCGPAASPTGPGSSSAGCPRRVRQRRPAPRRPSPAWTVCVIPGGFGVRGIEGKIGAMRYAREQRHPHTRPVSRAAVHGHRGGPQPGRADGGQSLEFDARRRTR